MMSIDLLDYSSSKHRTLCACHGLSQGPLIEFLPVTDQCLTLDLFHGLISHELVACRDWECERQPQSLDGRLGCVESFSSHLTAIFPA